MEHLRARLSLGANSLRASQEVPPSMPCRGGGSDTERERSHEQGWGGDACWADDCSAHLWVVSWGWKFCWEEFERSRWKTAPLKELISQDMIPPNTALSPGQWEWREPTALPTATGVWFGTAERPCSEPPPCKTLPLHSHKARGSAPCPTPGLGDHHTAMQEDGELHPTG